MRDCSTGNGARDVQDHSQSEFLSPVSANLAYAGTQQQMRGMEFGSRVGVGAGAGMGSDAGNPQMYEWGGV